MSSNEGRFETRGVWFFPQALHSSRFPAGEETLVPMTEVPNLSLPCSRVLAGYDFIEFEFSPVCYVVYLVFRLVVEMSFSLVFFLRHSIESGVLLHFLRRYTKQFHQNIFCWVLQSLFALRSQTKAAGRS